MFNRFRSLFSREIRSFGRVDDPLTALLFGGLGPTASGVNVTPETALRCTAVFGCVRVLAETVQQLPLHLHRRLDGGGRERADGHPAEALVADLANGWTTSSEFRLALQTDLSLRGNAFAYVGRVDGRPVEMIQLPAASVTVETDQVTTEPSFKVSHSGGGTRTYSRHDVLHLRGFGAGVKGLSPIECGREAIGLSIILEKYGAALFGRGARPAGTLKTGKRALTPEQQERLRASFEAMYRGGDNAGRTIVLEEDWAFEPHQLTSTDAQFLENRRWQLMEVARLFRIPPHLLGDLERMTFSNVEQMGATFLQFCMLPILRTWTDALRLTLLTAEERAAGMYFEFEVNDLARADLSARFTAYSQALNGGILSANEVRELENRAPYPGGDQHRVPVNTEPANSTTKPKPTVVSNAA